MKEFDVEFEVAPRPPRTVSQLPKGAYYTHETSFGWVIKRTTDHTLSDTEFCEAFTLTSDGRVLMVDLPEQPDLTFADLDFGGWYVTEGIESPAGWSSIKQKVGSNHYQLPLGAPFVSPTIPYETYGDVKVQRLRSFKVVL